MASSLSNKAMDDFLTQLPKCEHHMHLEGCLTPDLLFKFAKSNSIELPDPRKHPEYTSPETLRKRYEHFDCLQDFLDCHYLAMSALVKESDFEELAWEYFVNAHKDGVWHAEVFFDPQSHTSRDVSFNTVLSGYNRACKRAEQEFGMTTKLILCFLRHLPSTSAQITLETAVKAGAFEQGMVHGLGLDSSEVGFPPNLFKEQFQYAKDHGVHRTAHAGEEGDTSYIIEALDLCHVERIDHGLRLPEDPELMRKIAAEDILLTLCPLSNLYLQCVKKLEDLPIRTFLNAGVNFSINSDDPAYFGGYVLNNYKAVQRTFQLSVDEWVRICEGSVRGSWVEEARKNQIISGIRKVAQQFR